MLGEIAPPSGVNNDQNLPSSSQSKPIDTQSNEHIIALKLDETQLELMESQQTQEIQLIAIRQLQRLVVQRETELRHLENEKLIRAHEENDAEKEDPLQRKTRSEQDLLDLQSLYEDQIEVLNERSKKRTTPRPRAGTCSRRANEVGWLGR